MECLWDNGAKVRGASRPSPMNSLQHLLSWKAFETKKKMKKKIQIKKEKRNRPLKIVKLKRLALCRLLPAV